jgi:hypothetical protein
VDGSEAEALGEGVEDSSEAAGEGSSAADGEVSSDLGLEVGQEGGSMAEGGPGSTRSSEAEFSLEPSQHLIDFLVNPVHQASEEEYCQQLISAYTNQASSTSSLPILCTHGEKSSSTITKINADPYIFSF